MVISKGGVWVVDMRKVVKLIDRLKEFDFSKLQRLSSLRDRGWEIEKAETRAMETISMVWLKR